jgi:hypothetical protein
MINKLTFVTLTLFTLSVGNYAQGSNPKKERSTTTSPLEQTTEKKISSIQDKAHVEAGFINVLKVKDNYFLSIPDSILGRDLLFAGRVEKISNNKQISAGQIRKDPILIRFQKKGNRIVIK